MFRSVLLSLLSLLPVLLGSCNSFGEKKPDFTITFHALAGEEDPPKTKFPFDLNGKRVYFKLVPEVSQQNIAAFYDFPAKDGTVGLTLQLDFRGKASLEIITRDRKDEYLLAMVNAKPVDFVVIDGPVLDGIITIWQGVPKTLIKQMEKKFKHITKKSAAPNMSDDMEMLPTTKGEKRKALKQAQDESRAEKQSKSSKNKEQLPPIPALNLPNGPVSPTIPVEGGTPPAPAPGSPPSGNPPLPKP